MIRFKKLKKDSNLYIISSTSLDEVLNYNKNVIALNDFKIIQPLDVKFRWKKMRYEFTIIVEKNIKKNILDLLFDL